MKYKVGDKARVRRDLVVGGEYGGWYFDLKMSSKKGVTLTVDGIDLEDYYIMDDGSEYWTDEMLEDVEEEFKLPEKWYIKIDHQNYKLVGDWFLMNDHQIGINDLNKECYYNWYFKYPRLSHYTATRDKPHMDYTEITFDQFKKYVLKSESTPVKENKIVWLNGRWYRILNNWWGKFETIHNSGKRIKFSESITASGKYEATPKNIDLISEIELLTDLSEIQQYLPENHPDKIKKRTKKVEDLKYPDVVHCSSKEQRDKINSFAILKAYEGDKWYLTGAHGVDDKPYTNKPKTRYVNYEFSDIIFPEEKVVKEWSSSGYVVLLNRYMGIVKGTISRIKHDYGHGVTISHAIYNGDPANLTKDSECRWFPTLEEAQAFSDELLGKNKVETKPMLSKEELLAEAKRKYPVGTRFNAARGNRAEYTVKKDSIFRYSDDNAVCIEDYGNGTVYFEGEWGEITYKPSVQEKEELVQTSMSQKEACRNCSYYKIVKGDSKRCCKQDFCHATGGQHYPKDNSSERYIVGIDPFDAESSSDGTEVGKFPSNKGMGFYEQMEKMCMQAYSPMGLIRGLYNIPAVPKDCFESDEIYVPIIKTEVKQIKL